MPDPAVPATPEPLHQVTRTWSPYDRLSGSLRARLRSAWNSAGLNPDVASKLRYEVDMLLLRTRCATSPAHRQQVRQLAAERDLRVHLGCGNALFPGWLNVDCYPPTPQPDCAILTIDLRRRWPLADASVSALFSEHFLEHLPAVTVREHILPEIFRVLAPGRPIRIAVPNGEYFVEQYLAARAGRADPLYEAERHGKSPMTMLNEIAHGFGHYFAWDFPTLAEALAAAGFVAIRHAQHGDTALQEFAGRDRGDPWRIAMSLYVEARRPSAA